MDHQALIENLVCLSSPFSFFSLAVTVILTFLFKMTTLCKSGREQSLLFWGGEGLDFFGVCLFFIFLAFVFLFFEAYMPNTEEETGTQVLKD